MSLTEYDVIYAIKEFLLNDGFTIITWNPPGSQGTFTIPNPGKDPNYKGQTGSESPDLIAFKDKVLLILEAKDSIIKSIPDIIKIDTLLNDQKRKALLFNICNHQMEAMGIPFDAFNCKISKGIAAPKDGNYIKIQNDHQDFVFFLVSANSKWNNKIITNPLALNEVFSVEKISQGIE